MPEYYDSIDYLPVLAWEKIHATGDVSFLLKKRSAINASQKGELDKAWEALYNEYVNVFGLGEQFKRALEMQVSIALLKLKKITTGDENIQTFIDVKSLQLAEMQKNNKGGDIYKAKKAIEKKMGIRIPLAEVSVREFYSYLRDLK